jgi:hypothetical protein
MVVSGITATAKEMNCATSKEREQMVATHPVAISILVRFRTGSFEVRVGDERSGATCRESHDQVDFE